MSSRAHHQKILEIVRTDRTFEPVDYQGRDAWMGKCIHCNAHLYVAADGAPISRATVEHILPKTAGGTDEPSNLALACARCNHEKGVRHDRRTRTHEHSATLVEKLLEKRRKRWRAPDEL